MLKHFCDLNFGKTKIFVFCPFKIIKKMFITHSKYRRKGWKSEISHRQMIFYFRLSFFWLMWKWSIMVFPFSFHRNPLCSHVKFVFTWTDLIFSVLGAQWLYLFMTVSHITTLALQDNNNWVVNSMYLRI